jgi:hypothetical protein
MNWHEQLANGTSGPVTPISTRVEIRERKVKLKTRRWEYGKRLCTISRGLQLALHKTQLMKMVLLRVSKATGSIALCSSP